MKNYVTVLGIALAISLAHAASAQSVAVPAVPAGLEVEAPNQAFLIGHAIGTQNYVCQPSSSLGRVAWTLFTPEATLFDDDKVQIITHYFSPNPAEAAKGVVVRATWQAFDTSLVWARATASSTDPAFVAKNAVAWVKLEAVGTQAGPTGGTTLSETTFVQRINTYGGVAPETGCDIPTDVGNKAFMPYTADYVFYKK